VHDLQQKSHLCHQGHGQGGLQDQHLSVHCATAPRSWGTRYLMLRDTPSNVWNNIPSNVSQNYFTIHFSSIFTPDFKRLDIML